MNVRDHTKEIFVILSSILIIYANRTTSTRGFENFIYKEAVFYLIVPVLLVLALRLKPADMGLGAGDGRKVAKYFVLLFVAALPFMIAGSRMDAFRLYYPRFSYGSWWEFLRWELLVGVLMLATEVMYRGYLMFGLKKYGRVAIVVQAVPYMLIHLGKPDLEVYYSFFAGVAFGYVDWESRTVLTSFLLHWTTSICFDLMCTL